MKTQKLAIATTLIVAAFGAHAQISSDVVKIGVLTDLSGTYSDLAGPGSVVATKMAIDDFLANEQPPFKIEMISADHQNKPDIGSSKAREWFDREAVDVVTDLVTTPVGLAVMRLAKEKDRVVLATATASSSVTNEYCNDRTIHYTYDTYALANGTAKTVTQQGGKSWFFLTADYAFGHSLEKDSTGVVTSNGGKVVGRVRHPFPGGDLSAFLLQAQASGASVIGLANAGSDTANSIKQAAEFGITPKQSLAGLLLFLSDVHGLGLQNTQDMYLTTGFYWDFDDQTRAWSKRFYEHQKSMPTMVHAGQYSAVYNYLRKL